MNNIVDRFKKRINEKIKSHSRFLGVHAYDTGVVYGLNYAIEIIEEEMIFDVRKNKKD